MKVNDVGANFEKIGGGGKKPWREKGGT